MELLPRKCSPDTLIANDILGLFFLLALHNPFWVCILQPSSGYSLLRARLLYHTQRRATVGRTTLDE
jgi:hypothetical protein